MSVIVPMWFFEFGSVMYFVAAFIGFLLSLFSFKLYNYTRKRHHLFLNLSFIFITIGFTILTISNVYSSITFDKCEPSCLVSSQKDTYNSILYGNYAYYITSIVGYGLFLLSYPISRKIKGKKLLPAVIPVVSLNFLIQSQQIFVLYPFENVFFQPFHLLSSVLLLFIALRTFSNFKQTKSKLSLLVPLGFIAILSYHILMFSVPFSPLFFAFAHISLLIGFCTLLLMLERVTRR